LYVCAAFLLHWRRKLLLERDFQVIKTEICLCKNSLHSCLKLNIILKINDICS
jgi:hypothetical protein